VNEILTSDSSSHSRSRLRRSPLDTCGRTKLLISKRTTLNGRFVKVSSLCSAFPLSPPSSLVLALHPLLSSLSPRCFISARRATLVPNDRIELTFPFAFSSSDQWHGSVYQESMSLEVQTDATSYEGRGYTTYGFEYEPSEGSTAGHIQWAINGTETWRLNDNAMGPSADAGIGQRKVSVEPMTINLVRSFCPLSPTLSSLVDHSLSPASD
jgi:hypothetical protein